jgi:DNA-binding transcriptional ArsR family regulator
MSARPLKPRRKITRKINSPALIFAALGDETRLRLVERMCASGPVSISRLAKGSPMTRQAVTKHLQVLASVGLASSSPLGRERVWEFESEPLDAARQCLDGISAQWDQALGRLKKFVEE